VIKEMEAESKTKTTSLKQSYYIFN